MKIKDKGLKELLKLKNHLHKSSVDEDYRRRKKKNEKIK